MKPIALVEFAEGITRPVYEDEHGQFTLDNDGKPICGVWYIPRDQADEPIIVGEDPGDADFRQRTEG